MTELICACCRTRASVTGPAMFPECCGQRMIRYEQQPDDDDSDGAVATRWKSDSLLVLELLDSNLTEFTGLRHLFYGNSSLNCSQGDKE